MTKLNRRSKEGIQGNLFSVATNHKRNAIQAIEALHFAKAEEDLKKARGIDPYLADLISLERIILFLEANYTKNIHIGDYLSKIWFQIPVLVRQKKLSYSEGNYIDKRLSVIAASFLQNQNKPFVDTQESLHWGCLKMIAGEYELARKLLLDTLSEHNHPRADLWGYYGDVNVLLKNNIEANNAYLKALLFNPQELDLFRLRHKPLSDLYERLSKSHSPEESRVLLLTYGWLENVLDISSGKTWISESLNIQDQIKQAIPKEKCFRWHQFSICLYLDQIQPEGTIDYEAREKMMALDEKLFKLYLKKIEGQI